MESPFKKFLFKLLIPFFIGISRLLFGNRSNKKQIPENLPSTFFVLGSGRNGSTLTAQLLNRHPNIFLPPEQTVLPYSIMKWYLFPWRSWKKILGYNMHDYATYNQNWHMPKEEYGKIGAQLEKLESTKQNPVSVFASVFSHYGNLTKSELHAVGDHSPMCTVHYKMVLPELTQSKFIFLVRHPFDVILSYSKFKENPASETNYACWKWNNSVEAYQYLKKTSPERVLLVSYEELTGQADDTCRKILEFLNMEYYDLINAKIESSDQDSLGTAGHEHHKNLNRPVGSFSVNKWKKELPDAVYNQALPLVKKHAEAMGYDLRRNTK